MTRSCFKQCFFDDVGWVVRAVHPSSVCAREMSVRYRTGRREWAYELAYGASENAGQLFAIQQRYRGGWQCHLTKKPFRVDRFSMGWSGWQTSVPSLNELRWEGNGLTNDL